MKLAIAEGLGNGFIFVGKKKPDPKAEIAPLNDETDLQRQETEAEASEEPVDPAWAKLMELVSRNEHFRLVTFDGLFWIDPFNGELISAPFDLEKAIEEHFREHTHWRKGRSLKATQLYLQRWLLWLEENKLKDQRFQQFTRQGFWFNPALKQPTPHITADMMGKSDQFIRRIAHELAKTPEADPHTMASLEELEVALGLRAATNTDDEEAAGEESGIRLTQSG